MKKIYCMILLTIICMTSCVAQPKTDGLPLGLRYAIDDFPPVERFSSTGYEDYVDHFPAVDYAILHTNSGQSLITTDDPRLVRLLNALAYSQEEELTAKDFKYYEQTEIAAYKTGAEVLLEIHFVDYLKSGDNTLRSVSVLYVSGKSSLLVFISPDNGSTYAINTYPYDGLIFRMSEAGTLDPETEREIYYAEPPWVDLLVYAGFCGR